MNMINGNSSPSPQHEQPDELKNQPPPSSSSPTSSTSSSQSNNNNMHEILMNEFKKAHKKMFKNGFVENEYQQQQPQHNGDDGLVATSKSGNTEVSESIRIKINLCNDKFSLTVAVFYTLHNFLPQ